MMIKQIFAAVLAFLAGTGVSAGTFAFILVIGVVPRILQRCKVNNIILIENIIILGVIAGNLSSVCNLDISFGLGRWIIILYGLSTGIFVGCIAVALAEILHTFPIMFRRFKLKQGLKSAVFSMAFGKMAGAIFYFVSGYMNWSE